MSVLKHDSETEGNNEAVYYNMILKQKETMKLCTKT